MKQTSRVLLWPDIRVCPFGVSSKPTRVLPFNNKERDMKQTYRGLFVDDPQKDMAVGQNNWYHFGVGAPPILVYLSGDWDVHWGHGLLTHGNMRASFWFPPKPQKRGSNRWLYGWTASKSVNHEFSGFRQG